MIMIIVISMLIVMSSHTFLVFCAKTKKEKKDSMLAITPQANTPCPVVKKTVIVDREDRDSTRTKAGNRHMKSSKEPDSTDDAFKDLAARLAKKEKPDKTADSLLGDDDENPLAQFQMPERPVVQPNQDGTKLENIVEMQKKPNSKPTTKGATPTGGPMTAKDVSVANPPPGVMIQDKMRSKKSQKSQKMDSPPVVTDKTQSDPRGKDIDLTQIVTVEDNTVEATKKDKETGSSLRKNASISVKKQKKDKST